MFEKSFDEFLNEAKEKAKPGNYVSLSVALEEEKDIDIGDALFTPEGHVTLMYSKGTDVPHEQVLELLSQHKEPIIAEFDSVGIFDDGDDEHAAIVLKLASEKLHTMHSQLKDIGLQHSYDDYSPHVTYAYGVPKAKAQGIADKLTEKYSKGHKFELNTFKASNIVKDWAKK